MASTVRENEKRVVCLMMFRALFYSNLVRMNKTIEFNDDFRDVPVSNCAKTIDRTCEKIVLPISRDEINANPALKSQQNKGY